jgi:hypothetical protein
VSATYTYQADKKFNYNPRPVDSYALGSGIFAGARKRRRCVVSYNRWQSFWDATQVDGASVIESTIDFDSIVTRLDRSLAREKYKVWRDASWEDGSLLPLCGLKDALLPWPHAAGVFLKEYESVGIGDIRDFAEQCLTYMQRTKPFMLKSKLMTQYVIVLCLASTNVDSDAVDFIQSGELPKYFSTDVPYPVLLDLSVRKMHEGEGVGVWEIPKRLATNVLDLGLTRA